MKKKLVIFFTALFCIGAANSFASGTYTKYPVVLAHGMGASAEIAGIVDYWWGIDNALKARGVDVYKTSVNGMDSTAAKSAEFKKQVLNILSSSGAEKINIIGHSHGTVYTRHAISHLGLDKYVASHTSIAGPHLGSSIADMLLEGLSPGTIDKLGSAVNFVYAYFMGDTDPNSVQNAVDVSVEYMTNIFNPNTPNKSGVYYQSYAAKAKTGCPSLILQPTWLIMLGKEGANDGLVSIKSAKWGNFKGVVDGAWYTPGVDHLNIIDQFLGITPGFNANAFYVNIARDLRNRGF